MYRHWFWHSDVIIEFKSGRFLITAREWFGFDIVLVCFNHSMIITAM